MHNTIGRSKRIVKHFFGRVFLFGAFGSKNKNRQHMRPRKQVSNSFTYYAVNVQNGHPYYIQLFNDIVYFNVEETTS